MTRVSTLAALLVGCQYDESYLACFDAPDTHVTGWMGLTEITPPYEVGCYLAPEDEGTSISFDGTAPRMVPSCGEPDLALNLYVEPGAELLAVYEWKQGEAVPLETPPASEAADCPDELVQYRLPQRTSDFFYVQVAPVVAGELNLWLYPRDRDDWREDLW